MEKSYMEDYEVDFTLSQLIGKLVLTRSYWGFLFSSVRKIPEPKMKYPMAVSVDDRGLLVLLYNPIMLLQFKIKDVYSIIQHEGGHILLMHIPRWMEISRTYSDEIKKKNMRYWNIAADISVNHLFKIPTDMVLKNGMKSRLQTHKDYNLSENKTAEWYYYKILNDDKLKKKIDEMFGSGNEQKIKIQVSSDENGNESVSIDFGDGNSVEIDTHEFFDKNGVTKDKHDESDVEYIKNSVEREIKRIIKDAERNTIQCRGKLPCGVEECIQKMFKPSPIPYYQVIKKLVRGTRLGKYKRDGNKLNRKRMWVFDNINDMLPCFSPFPGKTRDYTFNIGIICDTSGSMTADNILLGLSAIKNIIEDDKYVKVNYIEIDATIQKDVVIKKISEIDFKPRGRGGTELLPAFERMMYYNPDVVLCFTDGYTEDFNRINPKKLPKKIIWVIVNGGTSENCKNRGYVVFENTKELESED